MFRALLANSVIRGQLINLPVNDALFITLFEQSLGSDRGNCVQCPPLRRQYPAWSQRYSS